VRFAKNYEIDDKKIQSNNNIHVSNCVVNIVFNMAQTDKRKKYYGEMGFAEGGVVQQGYL
jgi:hypothetical protein